MRDTDLDVEEVRSSVDDAAAGAVCLFVGAVRDHDEGRSVTELGYSAHPQAVPAMAEAAAKVLADYPVLAIACLHRIGDLRVGDIAIVAAVAAPHRQEAFDACHRFVDAVKASAPIWKHQRFEDGSDDWVGTP